MSFEEITDEQYAAFASSLKAGQYNLLLGAGASMDSSNDRGELPSGSAFKDELAVLKDANRSQTLQRIFSLLSKPEVESHVTKRFSGCIPGETYKLLSSFIWKRAFTFNIDDALHAAYSLPAAKQILLSYNFNEEYEDDRVLSELPLVYLHGNVARPVAGYIFSREEYIRQITTINPWMTVLAQFIRSEPFIVAGTSLDEVDLDFYLAHRNASTARDDRGPSIRVEPYPDSITRNDCKQHGMLLFKGTSREFFEYCDREFPLRPTPYELLPAEEQKCLPAGVSPNAALAFFSDFEMVPGSVSPASGKSSRFMYGHSPTWNDLEASRDIPRKLTQSIVAEIEKRLNKTSNSPRCLIVRETTGAGKTTVLRRCAYEFAQRGIRTLVCSALSKLESASTASLIDLIEGPLVIIVDNFADQVTAFKEILSAIEKQDVVVLAADRSYRFNYISQALSGTTFSKFDGLSLDVTDVERLISNYAGAGIVGSHVALKDRKKFAGQLTGDPIAVGCSRILNDFRPLDSIIEGLLSESGTVERTRYLVAALAQHCFRGGVKHEILVSAVGRTGLDSQLRRDHTLPLAYFDLKTNAYIVPQNATIASRMLTLASENNAAGLLENFVALANAVAPRVNRRTVKSRSPEARLGGRLFDYDAITGELLGELAPAFYSRTQQAWQWNSRYWEQVALMHLAMYHRTSDFDAARLELETAVQHARHAVATEYHPFPLTTLGKILIVQMTVQGFSLSASFGEAYEKLTEAIQLEKKWSRKAIQPYVTLFRGLTEYMSRGGALSGKHREEVASLMQEGDKLFSSDNEMKDVLASLTDVMS